MRLQSLLLVLTTPALAGDWSSWRGNPQGTQAVAGVGRITGEAHGYPVQTWARAWSTQGFDPDFSLVAELDGDPDPEVLGTTQDRVFLWDSDGAVLATSGSFANPSLVGLHDLDGDGVALDLLVAGAAPGGALVVLDASTLAELWSGRNPTLSAGVHSWETLVVDVEGDGPKEVFWNSAGWDTFDLNGVTFARGFHEAEVVSLRLGINYDGAMPLVAGDFYGTGRLDTLAYNAWHNVGATRVVPQGTAGSTCTPSGDLCLQEAAVFTGVYSNHFQGILRRSDVDGDGDHELISTSHGEYAVGLSVLNFQQGAPLWQHNHPKETSWIQSYEDALEIPRPGELPALAVYVGSRTTAAMDGCTTPAALNVFSSRDGRALASLPAAVARGEVNTGGTEAPEIVAETATGVAGYELICTEAWSSCEETGCTLLRQWPLEGAELPGRLATWKPDAPPEHYGTHFRYTNANSGMVDLSGAQVPEALMIEGGDLVAWSIDPLGRATEHGRHPLGACREVVDVHGEGEGAWILLEGPSCFTILDADLTELSTFEVDLRQGSGSWSLHAQLGAGTQLLHGPHAFRDPQPGDPPLQELPTTPSLTADLDGDGVDEVLVVTSGARASVTAYAWDGAAWRPRWSADPSATLGLPLVREQGTSWTVGDFNADGAPDIGGVLNQGAAAYAVFVHGQTGAVLAVHPLTAPGGYRGLLNWQPCAGDMCDAAGCATADGRDELAIRLHPYTFVVDAAHGQRTVSRPIDYPLNAGAMMCGDFNGDGVDEMAIAAVSNSDASWPPYSVGAWRGDGTPIWRSDYPHGTNTDGTVAAADLDGDELPDLLLGGSRGELLALSGVDGQPIFAEPLWLLNGQGHASQPEHPRIARHIVTADIDDDGYPEALVGGDDGYVYAVDVHTAEGPPAVLWSRPFGSPVSQVLPMDTDGDGELELVIQPDDGATWILDGGDAWVEVSADLSACDDGEALTLTGRSEAVDAVWIYLNGAVKARVTPGADGAWRTPALPWPGDGTFRVDVRGLLAGAIVAEQTVLIEHHDDDDLDGLSECDRDCDDHDPARYPGAPERCDGLDQDCDGLTPAEHDADGDGARACEEACDEDPSRGPQAVESCHRADDDCDGALPAAERDADGDGWSTCEGDCDDASAAIHPAAAELCNGLDDDCDTLLDDADVAVSGTSTWYQDLDGDGYAGLSVSTERCAPLPGWYATASDCRDEGDGASAVHPGAPELPADGVDQDCDAADLCYADLDGDGFGTPLTAPGVDLACDAAGLSTSPADCADVGAGAAALFPGALETCNALDDDCDGLIDDQDPDRVGGRTSYSDADHDGWGAGEPVQACEADDRAEVDGDCDDTRATVTPGRAELPDGLDNDCDGRIDEGTAAGDDDGDGFDEASGDCDDDDRTVHPNAAETCDGRDEDCDGEADDGLFATWYADADADGYGAVPTWTCAPATGAVRDGGDCDDDAPAVHPGAAETCDGHDEDCDGEPDDGLDFATWYADADADGYGAVPTWTCAPATGAVREGGDCDDDVPAVHPNTAERCNERDDDCDGLIDDSDPGRIGGTPWYLDADGDGFAGPHTTVTCAQPLGHKATSTDCLDEGPRAAQTWPGAPEIPANGLDEDCDAVDHCYVDADLDGVGATLTAPGDNLVCGDRRGESGRSDDCADAGPAASEIFPGAAERCNERDDDCDGSVDEALNLQVWYEDLDGDGYGTTAHTTCAPPAGAALRGDDCTDADVHIHPGAPEANNGYDDDCDGAIDEGSAYEDLDVDGATTLGGDCDDGDPASHPGASELAADGVDQDCNGVIDDTPYATDDDGDGVTEDGGDCDDTNAAISPSAVEIVDNLDNDCDGDVDDHTARWDDDGDCWCEELPCHGTSGEGCEVLPGGDPDDANADITPPLIAEEPADDTDATDTAVHAEPAPVPPTDSGCGCSTSPHPTLGALVLLAAAARRRRLVLAALGSTACSDAFIVSAPAPTELSVDLEGGGRMLDFGPVTTGGSATRELCLTNRGHGVDLLDVRLQATDLRWDLELPAHLEPDSSTCAALRCEPTEPGVLRGEVELVLGAVDLPEVTIPIVCEGEAPSLRLEPSLLDFGDVWSEEVRTVRVRNLGRGAVHIADLVVPEPFSGEPSGSRRLEPNATLDIPIGVSSAQPAYAVAHLMLAERVDLELPLLANQCHPRSIEGLEGYDGPIDDDPDGDGASFCQGDCAPHDPTRRPGVVEVADGVDQDCDGAIDEHTERSDDDGDGVTEEGGDCDDHDPLRSPQSAELANGRDDNCNGRIDEGTAWSDDDGDGWTERGGDCDDLRPDVHPGTIDAAGDGVDRDCDGVD